MSFEDALAYLREQHYPSEPKYRAACEVVADNLSELPYRVFIHLPGGLSGNNDPEWDAVKAASEECCGCGNERVFEPRDMRHEFESSTTAPIVLSFGDTLYIRPVGAPASAAYLKFEVIDSNGRRFLSYLSDPMSTSIDFNMLFSTPGFYLDDLVEPLERQNGKPAVFARDLKHVQRVPIVAISSIDLEAGTVTLILDAAVEAFDPDQEEAHTH
jgi:hypothetical protein